MCLSPSPAQPVDKRYSWGQKWHKPMADVVSMTQPAMWYSFRVVWVDSGQHNTPWYSSWVLYHIPRGRFQRHLLKAGWLCLQSCPVYLGLWWHWGWRMCSCPTVLDSIHRSLLALQGYSNTFEDSTISYLKCVHLFWDFYPESECIRGVGGIINIKNYYVSGEGITDTYFKIMQISFLYGLKKKKLKWEKCSLKSQKL